MRFNVPEVQHAYRQTIWVAEAHQRTTTTQGAVRDPYLHLYLYPYLTFLRDHLCHVRVPKGEFRTFFLGPRPTSLDRHDLSRVKLASAFSMVADRNHPLATRHVFYDREMKVVLRMVAMTIGPVGLEEDLRSVIVECPYAQVHFRLNVCSHFD